MKRNINLMQNGIDLGTDSLNELQKEYILQALANLGQRIGIKGDGISYRNFSFLDLLNNENISYNANEHIGWLKYQDLGDNELVATFGITKIDSGEETLLSNINTKDINDILYASNEIQFTIPINNIEKYSKNSIISNDGKILTTIMVGKILGYEDVDENNGILLYHKFDIKTNKPIYIAKIGYITSDSSSNYYYALELNKLENNNEYKLLIKIFDSKLLGIYTDTFNSLFAYSSHNNGEDIGFAFLKKDFLELENFREAYKDNIYDNYDSNSPLSVILHNISNNNLYASTELNLYLNSEANEFLYSDKNELRDTISLYKNEYNFIDIEEELYNFNNDITDFYRNILLYYNNKFFIENRSQFIKRILCKLYETVINESESKEDYYKMYIPLNYELSYVCNSNNELNIYWSNDIYVLLSNLTNYSLKKDILYKNNYLIFDYKEIDKVHSYRFEIDYNKKYENIINSVNVKKIYSMPFVDADETWNINGSSTSIRAIGKDAGNPNIIILYSKSKENNEDSYNLINSVSNRDLSSTEFIREQFQIDNSLFVNITNDVIYCYAWVPKITEVNKELFENSIILNICDLDCLESPLIKDYYLGSNILTLWYYSVENDTYKFKLIEKNGKAMPLGVTENLESIINATTLLDVNEHDLLILKAEIEALGQELLSGSNKRWAIIKNKKAKEYNDEYNNDLNAVIEYTDNLKYNISNDKNTIDYNQQEPFIKSIEGINRDSVTNTLYPNYTVTEKINTISTEEQVNDLINKIKTVENIEIGIDGNKFTVNRQIYDVIKQVLSRKTITKEVQVSTKVLDIDKTNNYLNEYVFNDNVPTIDFKEIFIRNINTLNKYNVLSLDKEGNIYYGYLGSSYELNSDKSILHLGTLTKNINIGTDTLINKNDFDQFKEYERLSLDFNHISLNATKTLSTSSYPYTIKKIGLDEFKVGKYWILDLCNENKIRLEPISSILTLFSSDTNNVDELNGSAIFFATNDKNYNKTIYEQGIIELDEYFDNEENIKTKYFLICINSVLNNLFGIDLLDNYQTGKITLNIGKNKLIVISNNGYTNIPLFCLLINDSCLSEKCLIEKTPDNKEEVDYIWSSDTLDVLVHETVVTNKSNELLKKNEISIITKFDKYNFDGKTDRYVIWDSNSLQIYPDQNVKKIIDFEILSKKTICQNGNEFNEITERTDITLEFIYTHIPIYEDGTRGTTEKTSKITIIDKYIDVSNIDENTIIRTDKLLTIPFTISSEPIEIKEYDLENSKLVDIPDCNINVKYRPIDFAVGSLISKTYSPMFVEPDNNVHQAYINVKYVIDYTYNSVIYTQLSRNYKESNLRFEKLIESQYVENFMASNASLDENNTIHIGNQYKLWYNSDTKTSKQIYYPDCEISVGLNRSGYYLYIGLTEPNIDNLNLTTVNLTSEENNWDGWRFLVHDLDNYDEYFKYGEYSNDEYDTYRILYQISDINTTNYNAPFNEERDELYIVIPECMYIGDIWGGKLDMTNPTLFNKIKTYTDNYAKPGTIYNVYRFINNEMPYEIFPNNKDRKTLTVISVDSQNIEKTNIELNNNSKSIIGDGNPYTLKGTLYCVLNIKYSDNNIYEITKELNIKYSNISCIYDANNPTLTLHGTDSDVQYVEICYYNNGNSNKVNINIEVPDISIPVLPE